MDSNDTTKYVIDANILINFGIFTPIENHVQFWARLSRFIKQGRIILLRDVAEECKYDPLKSWVLDQDITPTNDVRHRSIEIEKEYKLITNPRGRMRSEADPVIIAYAERKGHTVFSYESKKRYPDDPNKIPDVCEYLKVRYIREPSKVLEKIKFGRI